MEESDKHSTTNAFMSTQRHDVNASDVESGRKEPFYFTTNEVTRKELELLKVMQMSLFPVRYSDAFYENLLLDEYQTVLAFTTETHELVGVATARVMEGNAAGWLASCIEDVEGYIMTLGVASKCRRMGLGSKLLDLIVYRMLNFARCDTISLHVKDGNNGALRLYQSHDFTIAEQLPQHYHIDNKLYDAMKLLYRSPHRGFTGCLMQYLSFTTSTWTQCGPFRARLASRVFGKSIEPL